MMEKEPDSKGEEASKTDHAITPSSQEVEQQAEKQDFNFMQISDYLNHLTSICCPQTTPYF